MDESNLPKGEPPGGYEEIHLAARHRDADRVAVLLKAGVDPDVRNQREPNGDGGNTPLWFAAQGARPGGVPVAWALLDAGARVDERCEYGTTALHLAASWGHLEMVRFLIDKGANTQARDDKGATPLDSLQADRVRVQEEVTRGVGPAGGEEWLTRVPAVIDLLAGYETQAAIPPDRPEALQDARAGIPVPPATRRANFLLFAALIVFAIALAVVVFLWMQGVVRANGGIADPQHGTSLYIPSRGPTARTDFVLPSAAPCFTSSLHTYL